MIYNKKYDYYKKKLIFQMLAVTFMSLLVLMIIVSTFDTLFLLIASFVFLIIVWLIGFSYIMVFLYRIPKFIIVENDRIVIKKNKSEKIIPKNSVYKTKEGMERDIIIYFYDYNNKKRRYNFMPVDKRLQNEILDYLLIDG